MKGAKTTRRRIWAEMDHDEALVVLPQAHSRPKVAAPEPPGRVRETIQRPEDGACHQHARGCREWPAGSVPGT
jgi:hypothetical protein